MVSEGDGEVCFRGRYNFMGYLHDAEKTATVTDKDGWFYTGDIGHADTEGNDNAILYTHSRTYS